NEPIDDGRAGRMKLPGGVSEHIESLGHRAVQLSCLFESPPQVFQQDFRGHWGASFAASECVGAIIDKRSPLQNAIKFSVFSIAALYEIEAVVLRGLTAVSLVER